MWEIKVTYSFQQEDLGSSGTWDGNTWRRISTGSGQSRVITQQWSLYDEEEARGSSQALEASHVWSFRGDHCTMKRHEDQHRFWTLVMCDHSAEITVRWRGTRISTDIEQPRVITPQWSLCDKGAQVSAQALDASHVWSLRGDHCTMRKRHEDQHRPWTLVTCDHSLWSLCDEEARGSAQALDSHVWSFRGDHCTMRKRHEDQHRTWTLVTCDHSVMITFR